MSASWCHQQSAHVSFLKGKGWLPSPSSCLLQLLYRHVPSDVLYRHVLSDVLHSHVPSDVLYRHVMCYTGMYRVMYRHLPSDVLYRHVLSDVLYRHVPSDVLYIYLLTLILVVAGGAGSTSYRHIEMWSLLC